MLTTGVIDEEAGNRRQPVLQHADEAALRLFVICSPAQVYCDAAYEMDAEKFASMKAPKQQGSRARLEWEIGYAEGCMSSV